MLNEITLANHPLVGPQADALAAVIRAASEAGGALTPCPADKSARRALAVVVATAALAVGVVLADVCVFGAAVDALPTAMVAAGTDVLRRASGDMLTCSVVGGLFGTAGRLMPCVRFGCRCA